MLHQLFIISSLALTAYCQQQYQGTYSTLTTTPAPAPPAQVHYVNIGADLAGDYKFGYDTGKGPKGQSFREETRSADGTVRGAYGYTDANGQQRIVKYSAGKEGFKIEDDSPASGGGSQSAPTAAPYRPPQTLPPQIYRPAPTAPPQAYRPPALSSQSYPSPQSYSSPSSSSGGGYLELNVRPAQQQYRPPTQTLRQVLPSQSYSSLSSGVQYSPSSYSSGSSGSGSGSSMNYPPLQPTLQSYRPPAQAVRTIPASVAPQQPVLRSYSGLATTARPEEETWGPPVINTALLSYNIGSQGGITISRLSQSSSSSSESYSPPPEPTRPAVTTNTEWNTDWNTPILRTYSDLSGRSAQPVEEEKWGPPVINTALLSYNIGSQQG